MHGWRVTDEVWIVPKRLDGRAGERSGVMTTPLTRSQETMFTQRAREGETKRERERVSSCALREQVDV